MDNSDWLILEEEHQLQEILSSDSLSLIFKHSTRCSISSMALSRMNAAPKQPSVNYYFLDLIRYRDLSNAIAEKTGVVHQSPQLIVLKGGKVLYHTSHGTISPRELAKFI